jgi:hypothetical protein
MEKAATLAGGRPLDTANEAIILGGNSTIACSDVGRDVITIIRDPDDYLGKRFVLEADGCVAKKTAVNILQGQAVMRHVPDHEAMAALLRDVSEDPHAAIINAVFRGIEIGEEFVILSEAKLQKHLGLNSDAKRIDVTGVFEMPLNGRQVKAMGRFKENVLPSTWQLLDRDVDEHTPEKFRNGGFETWLDQLTGIIPSIDVVAFVRAASTSARVFKDGIAVGQGNGHVWVKIKNADDVERTRTAMMICAVAAGITWLKPRFNSKTHEKCGISLTTILDPSVWTPGRLVFVGKPVVEGVGLTVAQQDIQVIAGIILDELDTSELILPEPAHIAKMTKAAGVEMKVRQGTKAGSLSVDAYDLTLDMLLETKRNGEITVQEAMKIPGKVKCQTPFRDSSSFAAFLSLAKDGMPFVYDVGTSVTHWLTQLDQASLVFPEGIGGQEHPQRSAEVEERRNAQKSEAEQIGEGNAIENAPRAEVITREQALDRLVFISSGSRVADLSRPGSDLAKADFIATYQASVEPIQVGDRIKQVAITGLWLANSERMTVMTRTFKAGGPIFTNDPDEKKALNSWKPYRRNLFLSQADRELANLFLDHVEFLFPVVSEREHFLDWLAHIEQRPGELPHSHYLHIAKSFGLGRNWLASLLARVWAGHTAANFDLVGSLSNGFNGRLSQKILAVVDEIREGGGEGPWALSEKLKSMMTAEKREINPKYAPQSVEFNSCRFLLFSNHESALPLEEEDRRFNVVSVDCKPRPVSYYTRLYNALSDSTFIESVATFLSERDISQFKPGARPVLNAAKKQMVHSSKSEFDLIAESIRDFWPRDVITAPALISCLSRQDDGTSRMQYMSANIMKTAKYAFERAGMRKYEKKIRVGDKSTRVYLIRNSEHWLTATPQELAAEALGPDDSRPIPTTSDSGAYKYLDELEMDKNVLPPNQDANPNMDW